MMLCYVVLSRLPVAMFTWIPFLVGGLGAGAVSVSAFLLLVLVGFLYQALACHLNDFADLEADSLNPKRKRSPLVQRKVTAATVVGWAVFEAVVLCAGGWAISGTAVVAWCWTGLLVLVAWGNLYQKVTRGFSPVVWDCAFAFCMGAPLIVTMFALGATPPWEAFCLAGAYGLHMFVVNVCAGNLKDLASDRSAGLNTTALAFRVRERDGGGFVLSRPYVMTLLSGQLAALGLLAFVAFSSNEVSVAAGVGGVVLASLATGGLVVLLWRGGPFQDSPGIGLGETETRSFIPAKALRNGGFAVGNVLSFLLIAAGWLGESGRSLLVCVFSWVALFGGIALLAPRDGFDSFPARLQGEEEGEIRPRERPIHG